MRTYIIIVLVLLSLKGFSQNHKEIFSVENDKLGVGWHWGRTGIGTDCPINVYAMNLLAGGFYIDVGGMPSKHGSDVRISVWDDRSAFFAHIGYQVPLTKWFRITPIIGMTSVQYGTTNGHDWSVGPNGIVNSFNTEKSIQDFDFGSNITFNIKNFNIHITVTRYSLYGGISVEFPLGNHSYSSSKSVLNNSVSYSNYTTKYVPRSRYISKYRYIPRHRYISRYRLR